MQFHAVIPAIFTALTLVGPTVAGGPDFLDDFDDNSFIDNSPVTWVPTPALPANMAIVDGDLTLTINPVFPYVASAMALSNFGSGASIRAQMAVSSCPARSVVAFTDASIGLQGYIAVLRSCSRNYIELFRIDGTTVLNPIGGGPLLWPYGPDVEHYIQLDVFDGVVSMRVWRPGEPFPAPAISAVDTNYPSGVPNLAVQDLGEGNCSGDGDLTNASSHLPFVKASSTPLTHSGIGDISADGAVNIEDLLAAIAAWGSCPPAPAQCPADITGDGSVNIADLLLVIANWGS